ncbi:uncharacterized protein LOC119656069 [Hermetia illucens]|uniref:uncharacterized protein LOC119656069 n=1 Tax=Hermetia illucens TaxID=343691 RepID=UPI0018CC42DE|nr:uncharacterized protein LOC119656069 [Hermetia illucens]
MLSRFRIKRFRRIQMQIQCVVQRFDTYAILFHHKQVSNANAWYMWTMVSTFRNRWLQCFREDHEKPPKVPKMWNCRHCLFNKNNQLFSFHVVSAFQSSNRTQITKLVRICLSDESSVYASTDKSGFVRRPDEKFEKDCIVKRVNHRFTIIARPSTGRL